MVGAASRGESPCGTTPAAPTPDPPVLSTSLPVALSTRASPSTTAASRRGRHCRPEAGGGRSSCLPSGQGETPGWLHRCPRGWCKLLAPEAKPQGPAAGGLLARSRRPSHTSARSQRMLSGAEQTAQAAQLQRGSLRRTARRGMGRAGGIKPAELGDTERSGSAGGRHGAGSAAGRGAAGSSGSAPRVLR